MATEYLKTELGQFLAAEDLSDWTYRGVQLNSLNPEGPMWQKPTESSESVPVGVLTNNPAAGEAASVQFFGVCKMYLGGTESIQASRPVGIQLDGSVTEGGNFGISLESGEPGNIIEVLIGRAKQYFADDGSGPIPTAPDYEEYNNFSFDEVEPEKPIKVRKGQQMSSRGKGKKGIKNEGPIINEGTLFIEV